MTQRRDFIKAAAAGTALSLPGLTASNIVFAQDKSPIKVGVLHSLSGTMAISETALKNTALMTFEDEKMSLALATLRAMDKRCSSGTNTIKLILP